MSGIITVVQESRFQLVPEHGSPMQFVLAHNAGIEPQDLGPLQRRQAHVTVHYNDSNHLIAGIAHAIEIDDRNPPQGAAR